ncbi:hypothetical protein ATCC90586_005040 [Pythium insidiosum]|nr:hypothetical protein ATCC90586_005040 [Pythium insidiosum]
MRGRLRLKGQGRQPRKYRNESTALAQQVEVASYFVACGDIGSVISKFYKDLPASGSSTPAHVNNRGVKTIWVKSSDREKERIAAMLLGDAKGQKYTPFWEDPPVMLLRGDFSGHWTQSVTAKAGELGVILHKVPPRFTYVCQPADITWNKPPKDHMRAQWMDWIAHQVRENGRFKPPTRSELVAWLSAGWTALTPSTIRSGFKRAKIQVWRDDGTPYVEPEVTLPQPVLGVEG